jgi:hypothetical protein
MYVMILRSRLGEYWRRSLFQKSVFLIWGPGIRDSEGRALQMTEIAAKLAPLASQQ